MPTSSNQRVTTSKDKPADDQAPSQSAFVTADSKEFEEQVKMLVDLKS